MTSQYRIIIKNMSAQSMSFYAFQQQASFTASGATLAPQSNSLAWGPLAPFGSSGTQLDFVFDARNYAGARANVPESSMAMFSAAESSASFANTTTDATAVQPIAPTSANSAQSLGNHSILSVSPLGLSTATFQADIADGYFGVQIPAYSPSSLQEFYCGCAVINQDGSVALSSYVSKPPPNSQLCCAPLPLYYIKTGSYPPGASIIYDTSQSASCDFTTGFPTINVAYNSDGSFTTTNSF